MIKAFDQKKKLKGARNYCEVTVLDQTTDASTGAPQPAGRKARHVLLWAELGLAACALHEHFGQHLTRPGRLGDCMPSSVKLTISPSPAGFLITCMQVCVTRHCMLPGHHSGSEQATSRAYTALTAAHSHSFSLSNGVCCPFPCRRRPCFHPQG